MKKLLLIGCLLVIAGVVLGQDTITSTSKGNEYYRQSQFDLSEIQYRKALASNPKNFVAQFNLANALQQQKKYDEAIKVLEDLAGATTDVHLKSAAYYNQGVAYTRIKNLESSIDSYKKALILNPDDQQARENLQKALSELKQQQQQQKNQQKQQQQSKMSQKEADQKLKLLEQKEKDLQQRIQNQKGQKGGGQSQDW
jgi:tetratricopeptide (TPR) repeat protein